MGYLSEANKKYMKKEFDKALGLYQDCLDQLITAGNPPRALVKHCEKRIHDCKAFLTPTSEPLALKSTLTPSSHVNREDRNNLWVSKSFYPTVPTQRLPLVSIIIPHFNSGGMIYQALDSIAAQNFRDIETIIVDDVSTDGSLSDTRVAAYPAWMRVRLVRLKSNGGPARSRNVGIQLSQGRGICLLDADDWLDDKTLIERWRVVDSDPTVAAAFSTMTYADAERKSLGTVILKGAEKFGYADFTSNKFPCSALLFRRRSLALDPFDDSLVYGEDYECFSRIAQRGGVYRVAPGTVWYRQHGNSLTHKDALKDLLQRVETTRYVHSRELSWSYVNFTHNLPETLVVDATSMRAFPVACIYALRSQPEKAAQLSTHIDPDLVASKSPSSVAGSIRFFITREEFQPSEQLPRLLAKSDTESLRRFFAGFFSARHQRFLSALLQNLLPAPAEKNTVTPTVAAAPWVTCTWNQFINGPDTGGKWGGYVALHRSDEHIPEAAQKACAALLASRPDLEGLYAFRLCATESEVLVDVDTIASADPDSPEINRLGNDLSPALVLHELAARALWAWLVHPPKGSVKPLPAGADAAFIERKALEGVRALRLKVIGGVAACHVLRNQRQETTNDEAS